MNYSPSVNNENNSKLSWWMILGIVLFVVCVLAVLGYAIWKSKGSSKVYGNLRNVTK